jgi:hypothetical protein
VGGSLGLIPVTGPISHHQKDLALFQHIPFGIFWNPDVEFLKGTGENWLKDYMRWTK